MKCYIITNVFIGKYEKYNNLKSLYIGGAEVYLQELITRVLKEFFDRIIVLQNAPLTMNVDKEIEVRPLASKQDYEKNDFVIMNGLQRNICSRQFLSKEKRHKLVAIHHGTTDVSLSPLPRNIDVYWHYKFLFEDSASHQSFSKGKTPFAFFLLRSQLARYHNLFTLNRLSSLFDKIVSVDRASLKYIINPSTKRKWTVIYNSVDLNLFNPDVESVANLQEDNMINILVPRNLNIQRGVFILPELAILLINKGFSNFRFLVVGTGYLREYLNRFARHRMLRDKILLLGHKDHYQDMPSLYASSDVILVPSFSGEGTSLSVLEGMASQKPVVTTNVGGIADIGQNRVHKLSSDFDKAEIASNILKLVKNNQLASKIAEKGFHYVQKFHNIRDWSYKWKRIISTLI
jgi:glycosyltransferase involved in cell wall biosynthesis